MRADRCDHACRERARWRRREDDEVIRRVLHRAIPAAHPSARTSEDPVLWLDGTQCAHGQFAAHSQGAGHPSAQKGTSPTGRMPQLPALRAGDTAVDRSRKSARPSRTAMSRLLSISCARNRRAPLAETHRSVRIQHNNVTSPVTALAQEGHHAVPCPCLPNKRSPSVKSVLPDHRATRYKYQA